MTQVVSLLATSAAASFAMHRPGMTFAFQGFRLGQPSAFQVFIAMCCNSFFDRRCRLLSLAGMLLLSALITEAAASDPVTVFLASGRHFTGAVDARTDQARLWLRVAENSIVLMRPIDWDRVVSAQVGEKKLSVDEFRAAAATLESAEPSSDAASEMAQPARSKGIGTSAAGFEGFNGSAEQRPSRAPMSEPVRAIQIDAALGHFAAGVESTGIIVTLQPIDASGHLVAVDGTLEVDLQGQRFTVVTEGNGFPQLGRWTAAVRAGDFGPSGVAYRFPFQAVHPDFNFDLDPHGLVHARLTVPGQGVFEASRAMVRIRPYSAVRDHAQQTTGSRFLPVEQTEW